MVSLSLCCLAGGSSVSHGVDWLIGVWPHLTPGAKRRPGVWFSPGERPAAFTAGAATEADEARFTPRSVLLVVTVMVTGLGRSEGMTGRGRRPGRLLPLVMGGPAAEQALLATPL